LQFPVASTQGAFVPGRAWIILGGNPGIMQPQYLETIDGSWTMGLPYFMPNKDFCIVQVMKVLYLRDH
jgi:hypothetical protein